MDIDIKELVKTAVESFNLKDFHGDVVGFKYVENEFGTIESGGIGIQINQYGAPQEEGEKEDASGDGDLNNADDPAVAFVKRVKDIMLAAAENNGKRMMNNARGNTVTYTYNVDGEGFCAVMDKLLEDNRVEIVAYLDGANAKDAVRIKYVAPFIGHVHSKHRYSPDQMPNLAFKDAFEVFYKNGNYAVNKMSDKYPSDEAQKLYRAVDIIMIQLQK